MDSLLIDELPRSKSARRDAPGAVETVPLGRLNWLGWLDWPGWPACLSSCWPSAGIYSRTVSRRKLVSIFTDVTLSISSSSSNCDRKLLAAPPSELEL